jgi:hypothetical protein
MLSPTQAIQNAIKTTRNAVGMCDKWVAQYYGFSSSGYATAITHWNSISSDKKHPGDTNAPAGALVFWSGGSTGAGHVAISLGGGKIISTDYPRSGITSTTTIDAISNGWGEHYMGWSAPVFQGQVSNASFIPSPGNLLGGIAGGAVGGTILDFFTKGFGTDIKDILQRLALMLLGGTLIIIGILNMGDKSIKAAIAGPVNARKTTKDTANKEVEESTDAAKSQGEEIEEKAGV